MNQNVQMAPVNDLKKVNIHQLMEKCKSKAELYNFLTLDCKAFLPKVRATNVYFLRKIIRGEKKVCIFMRCLNNIVHQQRISKSVITSSH